MRGLIPLTALVAATETVSRGGEKRYAGCMFVVACRE